MKKTLKSMIILCLCLCIGLALTACKKDCEHSYDNSCDPICNLCGEERATSHSFVDADCDTPKTCSVCNATEGTAKGHSWIDADCDTPKTCSVCNATEGTAKGHSWVDADCDTPKTCSVCNTTDGSAKGHSFVDADCDTPKTCSVCNATEGTAGHNIVYEEGDCTNYGLCSDCGEISPPLFNMHIDEDDDLVCDRDGCTFSVSKSISTVEELLMAFTNGGKYTLLCDIDLGEETIPSYTSKGKLYIDIDLNGHTISTSFWAGLIIYNNVTIRFSNGNIVNNTPYNSAILSYGNIYLDNCKTVSDEYWGVYITGDGYTVITDSELVAGIYIDENSRGFISNTEIIAKGERGLEVFGSAYVVTDFDPTSYIFSHRDSEVSDNLDGTWSIAAPDFSGDVPSEPTFEEITFELMANILTPEIRYVELYGDAVTREGNTYTITIAENQFSGEFYLRVYGVNLERIDRDRLYTYNLVIGGYYYSIIGYEENDDGSISSTGTHSVHYYFADNNPNKIYYTINSGNTLVDTGLVLVVQIV